MAPPGFTQLPSSSVGYWRGTWGLSGPPAEGTVTMPQGTAGFSIGTGAVSIGGTQWHPSILYMLVLVAAEMVAFHALGRILK